MTIRYLLNTNICIFIKKIYYWLLKGKFLIIGTFLIATILIPIIFILFIRLPLIFDSIENLLNIVGCWLQVIGTGLTVNGLLKVRTYFGQPPLTQLILDWWKEFPKWKTNVVNYIRGTANSSCSASAKIEISFPDDPSQSIEKRFETLLKNVEHLKNTLIKHEDTIEKLSDSHEKHKKEVEENNKNMEDNFQSTLETLHTGDLISSVVGIIMITVGSVIITMSPELKAIYLWL